MVESMDRTIEKLRLKPEQVITIESIASGTPELDSTIIQLVNAGSGDLVIGSASGYVTGFTEAARANPDTRFLEFEGGTAGKSRQLHSLSMMSTQSSRWAIAPRK